MLCRAQSPALSLPELGWAVLHPIAAIKVKRISQQCDRIFLSPGIHAELDSLISGGRLDAYRHVFYMAAFSSKIKVRKIRRLGKAHEKANYRQFRRQRLEDGARPDSLSSAMDLINNELGFAIGCNFRQLSLAGLREMSVEAVKNGKAVILKRNRHGRIVDCNDKEINLKDFSNRWQVPGCLVPSSYSSSS